MTAETIYQGERLGESTAGPKPQNRRYREIETVFVPGMAAAVEAAGAGAERIYVCGERPLLAACLDIAGATGADVYLDGNFPTIRLGRRAVVRWAAQWTGDPSLGVDGTRRVWERVGEGVRESFGTDAVLLATPATTGRDLWLRVAGGQWPVMSAEAQAMTRRTALQGRIELFPPVPGEHRITALDMRVAYAAVLRELPIGEPVVLGAAAAAALAENVGYARARFRCRWSAPAGWDHVGILPADTTPRTWPLVGGGWVDAVELRLALRAGWKVEVFEALAWPGKANVLDRWRDRIWRHLVEAEAAGRRAERAAWRALLVQSVGAFHGAPRRRTVVGDDPPPTAENVRMVTGDRMVWTEREAQAAWPALSHPEWSTTIWARTRARLLSGPGHTGMLSLPAGSIVACRTDAIYTTAPPPAWEDDGAAGRFRVKHRTGPVAWPVNAAELVGGGR